MSRCHTTTVCCSDSKGFFPTASREPESQRYREARQDRAPKNRCTGTGVPGGLERSKDIPERTQVHGGAFDRRPYPASRWRYCNAHPAAQPCHQIIDSGAQPFLDTGPDGSLESWDAGQGDGVWDQGEPFVDANFNGRWDAAHEGAYSTGSSYQKAESTQYGILVELKCAPDVHELRVGAELIETRASQFLLQGPMFRSDPAVPVPGPWSDRGTYLDLWRGTHSPLSAWIDDRIRAGRLALSFGLRWDLWSMRGWLGNGGSTPDSLHGELEKALSPRLGLSVQLLDQLALRAGYAQYAQPPPLEKMLRGTGRGDPILTAPGKPSFGFQKSTSYETALLCSPSRRTRATLTGFLRRSSDRPELSIYQPPGSNTYGWVYLPSGESRVYGREYQ